MATNMTTSITTSDALNYSAEDEHQDQSTDKVAVGKELRVIDKREPSLLKILEQMQEKIKFLPAKTTTGERFPALYRFNRVVSASNLLESKFPLPFSPESYERSRRELYAVFLGLIAFSFFSFIAWSALQQTNFTLGGGFIYNTGLIGGILMLLALMYSIIKRIPATKKLISADASYYFHIVCGGFGAFIIVVHSSFDFGSINSSIAFFSMILIVISGALGRYLYTQCTVSLHRIYADIKNNEVGLFDKISSYDCKSAKRVRKRLSRFALHNFSKHSHPLDYLTRIFSIAWYGIYFYISSLRDIYRIIRSVSILSDMDRKNVREIKKTHKLELRAYIFKIVKMGYISLTEQILHHWRILHIPLLFSLLVTGVVHVVVVHMY